MYFNNSFVLSNSGRSGGNGGKDGVWGNAPHFTITKTVCARVLVSVRRCLSALHQLNAKVRSGYAPSTYFLVRALRMFSCDSRSSLTPR